VNTARSNDSYSALLSRLWHHLGRRRRRQVVLIVALMFVAALAEVVSLGSVLPFVGILAAPELFWKRPLLAQAAHSVGIINSDQLVLPLTIAFVAAALIAGAIRVLLLWVGTRFTFAAGADLSMKVYRLTLYQPYSVHLARSSSEVISGISNKIGGAVLGILFPALMLSSSIVLILALTIALVVINPAVAMVASLGFGGGYLLITWLSRRRLYINSQHIAREQTQLVKALQEGLGGIRDVLLDGTQAVYCDIYGRADQSLRRAIGENVFIRAKSAICDRSFGHDVDCRARVWVEQATWRRVDGFARAGRACSRSAATASGAATGLCFVGCHCGQPRFARRYSGIARPATATGGIAAGS
jgi:ATP-binding cassette, subfamily B, bacterial PglK